MKGVLLSRKLLLEVKNVKKEPPLVQETRLPPQVPGHCDKEQSPLVEGGPRSSFKTRVFSANLEACGSKAMSRRMNGGTAFASARTSHPRADDRKNGILYVCGCAWKEMPRKYGVCNGMAEVEEVAGGGGMDKDLAGVPLELG